MPSPEVIAELALDRGANNIKPVTQAKPLKTRNGARLDRLLLLCPGSALIVWIEFMILVFLGLTWLVWEILLHDRAARP